MPSSRGFFSKLSMRMPMLFICEPPPPPRPYTVITTAPTLIYMCNPHYERTVHAQIAKQTYVEAEWYNTSSHVLLLVMMQLYSTCFSQDHSTQFLRYKGHSCHIPPQCRFCHSPQLSQHPIWQCWQVQSRTIGQFQVHRLHRCSDGVSHPSHLRSNLLVKSFFREGGGGT